MVVQRGRRVSISMRDCDLNCFEAYGRFKIVADVTIFFLLFLL